MATIRKSNFDLTGVKLVKRGALVSWHGIRFTVSRVYMGRCFTRPADCGDQPHYFFCNAVQVVAS